LSDEVAIEPCDEESIYCYCVYDLMKVLPTKSTYQQIMLSTIVYVFVSIQHLVATAPDTKF